MQTIHIPEGYQQVMPYLILKDVAGFISFMQNIFAAEEKLRHMRDEHIIMHAEITIGACTIMLADSTDEYSTTPGAFFIYVADADATYHKTIAAGATVVTAMSDQPYGRSGGVKDPFGNTWWVTTQTPNR
jgi:PhnB protein